MNGEKKEFILGGLGLLATLSLAQIAALLGVVSSLLYIAAMTPLVLRRWRQYIKNKPFDKLDS